MDIGPNLRAVRSAIEGWSSERGLNTTGLSDALRFIDYKPSPPSPREQLSTSLARIRKLVASSAKGCDVAARVAVGSNHDSESVAERINRFHLLLILVTARVALSATAQALDPKSKTNIRRLAED